MFAEPQSALRSAASQVPSLAESQNSPGNAIIATAIVAAISTIAPET
jgi:hypothetical protein